MTRQEVQALHPNFESWTEQVYNPFKGSTEPEEQYGLPSYVVVCDFKLTLFFLENRLATATLAHQETEATDTCWDDIRDALNKKYGMKPIVSVGASTYTVSWKTGDADITLAQHEWGKASFISVVYRSYIFNSYPASNPSRKRSL